MDKTRRSGLTIVKVKVESVEREGMENKRDSRRRRRKQMEMVR